MPTITRVEPVGESILIHAGDKDVAEDLLVVDHERGRHAVHGQQDVVVPVGLEPRGGLHIHVPAVGVAMPDLQLVDRDVHSGELEVGRALVVEDEVRVGPQASGRFARVDGRQHLEVDRQVFTDVHHAGCIAAQELRRHLEAAAAHLPVSAIRRESRGRAAVEVHAAHGEVAARRGCCPAADRPVLQSAPARDPGPFG